MVFLLNSCSQSTEELFAESIQKGADAEEIALSNETASCIAQKGLPLIQDEEVLREKITTGDNYELTEEGLLKDEADLEKYSAITLRCLDDEELAAASLVETEKLDCYIKEAGDRDQYVETLIANDIVGLAEIDAACKDNP